MRLLIQAILAATPATALAHPGHDHNHWLSEPTHFILAGSIAIAVMGCGYLVHKSRKNVQQESDQ